MSNLKLVCWSGGCDSTLALFEALGRQHVWFVDGEPRPEVRSIAITQPNVPAGREQARARRRLLRELRSRGFTWNHLEVAIAQGVRERGRVRFWGQPRKMPDAPIQSAFWIGVAPPYLEQDEDLVLGWVQGELDNQDRVRAAFDALQRMQGKTGALELPHATTAKAAVLDRLRAARLLELCWYCEGIRPRDVSIAGPDVIGVLRDGRPCGQCNSCIDHLTALHQLDAFPRKALHLSAR